jgi:hypothetical protein
MRWALTLAAVGVAALSLVALSTKAAPPKRPDVPFAPLADKTLKDPDNPTKIFHVDFAEVERSTPLTRADRAKLTPDNIKSLSQEEVDQIYARLTPGPIPDGFMQGDLFFENGADGLSARLGEILGGGLGRLADRKIALLEKVGGSLWKGKRFYRDQRLLRNAIVEVAALKPLIDDERKVERMDVPRSGLLSRIRPTTEAWLLFPAKLHCGQSLLDGRRESIIIDYAYTDDLPGYQERPDSLAGRAGLAIRDEIRMVRPGFYLGRAYANRVFLLNFTVYDPKLAEAGVADFAKGSDIVEDCWAGEHG